jgi:septation ring formation regulator EzrA
LRFRNRRKIDHTLGQHAIFGNEQAAALRSDVDELRASVAGISDRLYVQFTTIAAHAEIAREQAELARREAKAELERTREVLIGLIEQVRSESTEDGYHITGSAPGASAMTQVERFDSIESTLAQLNDTVDTCFQRQSELADTLAAFLDTMLADQRGEPITGLSLT